MMNLLSDVKIRVKNYLVLIITTKILVQQIDVNMIQMRTSVKKVVKNYLALIITTKILVQQIDVNMMKMHTSVKKVVKNYLALIIIMKKTCPTKNNRCKIVELNENYKKCVDNNEEINCDQYIGKDNYCPTQLRNNNSIAGVK